MYSDNAKQVYLVTNRSASRVCYAVPELGIKLRDFQPGETKKIAREELEGLMYVPGGPALLKNYLQVQNEHVRKDLVGHTEPEYDMSVEQVRELITNPNNYDEWLDALDFAPEGVIDLIKSLSVSIPLTDTRKMESFKKKTGVDLARMIQANIESQEEDAAAAQSVPQRRVQKAASASDAPARRTTGSKYKVVSKQPVE